MSNVLALEWEHEQISGVLAAVGSGRVRLKQCFVFPRGTGELAGAPESNWTKKPDGEFEVRPTAVTGTEPDGNWLKTQLSQLGVPAAGEIIICLPRDDAFVRRLELPDTPEAELPTMVRFQMGAKSSVAMEEQYLDFLPLVKRTEMPGRDVLAATVPRQLVEGVRQQCQGLGAQMGSISLTTAAIAELVARSEADLPSERGGVSLVVGRFGNRLEISVFRSGGLLFSHGARLNQSVEGSEPQSIVPEVSRALVALRGAIADARIERAWILVSPQEQEVLTTALQRRLSCEVQPINPLAWVDQDGQAGWPNEAVRSQFAGPIGMLLARAEPRVPGLDFLNPRKTVVKVDNRRQQLKYAGLGAGLLAASLIGLHFYRLHELDAELEQLQFKERQANLEIKKGKVTETSLAAVEKWRGDGVDWLHQMGDLVERMPETDRMYLDSLQFTKNGAQPPKIVAHGFAREQKDVMELASGLHTSDRYRVMPYQASRTGADAFFPWRIEGQEILLNEPKPAKGGTKSAAEGRLDKDGAADSNEVADSDTAQKSSASSATGKPTAATGKPTGRDQPAEKADSSPKADRKPAKTGSASTGEPKESQPTEDTPAADRKPSEEQTGVPPAKSANPTDAQPAKSADVPPTTLAEDPAAQPNARGNR